MTFSLSSWSWLLELPKKEIFAMGARAFADGALTFPGNAQLNDHSQLAAIRRSDLSYQQKRFYLFNCDNIYSLETVEKLLLEAGDKYGFKISVDLLCFGLQRMTEAVRKDITSPGNALCYLCCSCRRILSFDQRRHRWDWLPEALPCSASKNRWVLM